jgi:spore coat polysaccharide biosynthesis predicted glycosyltransferase SpsG
VENVLVTFGGTDDNNLTLRVLRILLPLASDHDFSISIVNGPGYAHGKELKEFISSLGDRERTNLIWSEDSTRQISEYMVKSDFAITSAGRTVHELVSLRVPAVVIAANRREQSHSFSLQAGMSFLGIHDAISDARIKEEILSMLTDPSKRKQMKRRLTQFDLRQGKSRVVGKIMRLLREDVEPA